MPPWITDDQKPREYLEPEPVRAAQARGPVCTEAERAYLDIVLGDVKFDRHELTKLRGRIASERMEPTKRSALTRAWADMILARRRWDKLMEGVDFGGGPELPLYEELQREAEALAESEAPK